MEYIFEYIGVGDRIRLKRSVEGKECRKSSLTRKGGNATLGMVHTVIETPDFMSDAKAAGLSREEVEAVVLHLGRKPQAGNRIEGTGGARKVRFPGRGKGKSGGYRVISYFSGDDVPVFLLNVFAKGEKVNLSKAERNELKKILADIADAYRKGVRNVKGR